LSANLNNSSNQHQNSRADETVDASGLRVVETLICSGHGETLYASPGLEVGARVSLLQSINRQAASLNALLSLGNFDRLEIQLEDSRAVAQLWSDRMVFVRVATDESKPQEAA
jgi:alpha-galactosidase